jgi:hypothetical protein
MGDVTGKKKANCLSISTNGAVVGKKERVKRKGGDIKENGSYAFEKV